MVRGRIETTISMKSNGDIITLFKPIDQVLSSNHPKLQLPLNITCRRGRRAALGLLEIVVESKEGSADWKLKLEDINITRQFKPTTSLNLEDKQLNIYKFAYDITSILNTPEFLGKEGVNLVIKHEGGSPFRVKSLLFDVILEDTDATTDYIHSTGLLVLDSGDEYTIPTKLHAGYNATARLIAYSLRKASLEVATTSDHYSINLDQGLVEEHFFTVTNPINISIKTKQSPQGGPVIVSSLTIYRNEVKAPILEICGVYYTRRMGLNVVSLRICNKGDSSPDKLIITLLRKGAIMNTISEQNIALPPGGELVKEIELAPGVTGELMVRLIWLKIGKRWVRDHIINIE
jgi:hypothetical protein